MNIEVGNPNYGFLSLFSLLTVALMAWGAWTRRQAISRFATQGRLNRTRSNWSIACGSVSARYSWQAVLCFWQLR